MGFISAQVSFAPATLKNGCLNFCAGRHQKGLFRSWKPLVVADMRGIGFVSCSTEPGDMVYFGYFAQYQSEPKMRDTTRRIYYATYSRLSAGEHMAQ